MSLIRMLARYDRSTMTATRQPSWREHTLATLAAAGYRRGGARNAIVELLERQDCALSAQEIDDRLRARGRGVGRASVYRILELLTELRLVQKIDVGQGVARYERQLPDGHHHHHLVCDSCGQIEPFSDPTLEQAIERVARNVAFAVDDHDVVLHGACSDCRGDQPVAQ
jgi:Fur family ferric uptake transcriptional regulator